MNTKNAFNKKIPIYNADGTPFQGLELHKGTYDSVVMSLGDKITGDVYYKDNTLPVTMGEYIRYNGVKYVLVDPPTVVREGMVNDNSQLKGMTKYSFTFYHPMYMLGNFPFSDIAVTPNEEKYLSQNKTFSWIGNLYDFIKKIDKNLESTAWHTMCKFNANLSLNAEKMSDVLSFDKNTIAEALKKAYDTWKVPFVITDYDDVLPQNYTRLEYVIITYLNQAVQGETSPLWLFLKNLPSVSSLYNKIYYCKVYNGDVLVFHLIPCLNGNGDVGLYDVVTETFYGSNSEVTFSAEGSNIIGKNKKHGIIFGLPTNEIYDSNGNVFVFRLGKGLGLKNNSRTPKNNKIVTRIAGFGAERNIPYGYPQIIWEGDQTWDYTINNSSSAANSYPIYDGIVAGQRVRLIKHPFTRNHLMPSVYRETVNKKVNPLAFGYNPNIEIVDYYDAPNDYPNPIVDGKPSFEMHEFEDIYPRLGDEYLLGVTPYNKNDEYYTYIEWDSFVNNKIERLKAQGKSGFEVNILEAMRNLVATYVSETSAIQPFNVSWDYPSCKATLSAKVNDNWAYIKIVSTWYNTTYKVLQPHGTSIPEWDDTMNDDGEYNQRYFQLTLPQLSFDLYASAAVTEAMQINMRSGACLGCTFPVQVDWEDYKKNFYDGNGKFVPDGPQRDLIKYPKSNQGSITILVQKETETFGTLMPNMYQKPAAGDKFVILGISLPTTYLTDAEAELDDAMREYMLENNVYYYDYPLKFDEHFLATHTDILAQISNNNIIRFQYAQENPTPLYIKQITIKFGESPLPKYDITLTDDVEIVLNQIGQVTDDVSRMRVQVSELQKYYSQNINDELNKKLSRIEDDVCQGRITFQQGLDAIGSVIFHDNIGSPNFETGLYDGRGWRIDNLGNAEFESVRIRSYLEVVELLINRLQAQEGDAMFSDNDQVEKVERVVDENDGSESYILSLKEKYDGYITGQMYGNVIKGIINTLAAKQAGISDEESTSVEIDGSNKYYTSWMRVIGTHNTNNNLGINQIQVVLYGDDYTDPTTGELVHITPAGRNFPPCELMTIARWGCVDYSDPDAPDYEQIKASIVRRQRMFMISTTEGRVVKYTGVDAPVLKNGNYGVTIGELPEFVKNYPSVRSILNEVGEHTDWLYAQGVVVGNFIKVDVEGLPEVNIVDCGAWVNGDTIQNPTPRNGVYLYNEWNQQKQQYETHDVWHNNAKWRCLQHQPVVVGGVTRYYEPTDANSDYWRKLEVGIKGDDACVAFASPDKISVPCNNTGGVISSMRHLVTFSMKVGTQTATVTSVSRVIKPTGVQISNVGYNAVEISIDTSATASGLSLGVTFNVTGTYNNKTYAASVTVALIGAVTGQRGKNGRFYYYAQEWLNTPNVSFSVTDAEAPYFLYMNNYWVFNPSQNGTYTMQEMGTPSNTNANWELMVTDFKYIITEAIFSQNAHLGAAIISGDWMISQWGTRNGAESSEYTYFDANSPFENIGTNFIPNYAVDMRTGKTYQNNAIIRGTVRADNLYIGTNWDEDNKFVAVINQSMLEAFYTYMVNNRGLIVEDGDSDMLNSLVDGSLVSLSEESYELTFLDRIQALPIQGELDTGVVVCTGRAQKVFTFAGQEEEVFLPSPSLYPNKSVEVYNQQNRTINVLCASSTNEVNVMSQYERYTLRKCFAQAKNSSPSPDFNGVYVYDGDLSVNVTGHYSYPFFQIPDGKKHTYMSMKLRIDESSPAIYKYFWVLIESTQIF